MALRESGLVKQRLMRASELEIQDDEAATTPSKRWLAPATDRSTLRLGDVEGLAVLVAWIVLSALIIFALDRRADEKDRRSPATDGRPPTESTTRDT